MWRTQLRKHLLYELCHCECAKRFWDLHVKRNDSIITYLFSLLLKSVVCCPKCKWDCITFDAFNILTLTIPSDKLVYDKKVLDEDVTIFYIPKYSIRKSNRVCFKAKKKMSLKNITEEMKKVENFLYKPNKLKYIQVLDQEMKRIVNDNEPKNEAEFIFAFDDVENSENIDIIPLYIELKKLSTFPRLLFLKKNAKFFRFKKNNIFFLLESILKIL